jgi:hypothetical protein
MTTGFQQQDPGHGFAFPKQVPTPQHGQKAPRKALPIADTRSYQPRPGH